MPAVANLDAERAVLGSILFEPELFDECRLTTQHFYDKNNQLIFRAMQTVTEKGQAIDPVTLAKALGDALPQIGGVGYLNDLLNSVPTTANFEYYERLVIDAYKLHTAQQIAARFVNEPSEDLLEKMAKKLDELQEEHVDDEESIDDVLVQIQDDMFTERGEISGVPTGLKDLDDITSGMQDGDLIIVAGRPSMGKSAFAANIGINAARNGVVVDFFSLEMPKRMVLQRIISTLANIDGGKWKNANRYMSDDDKERAIQAMGAFKQLDFYIHDTPSQTLNDIKARIRKSLKVHPKKKHLVIIDYLTFMKSTGKYERRDLEIGAITRGLKQIARRYELPIILLSQLSRAVEQRQDKHPMMSDLRDSGSIEQDSDLIMFLYRDDYYNQESEKQNIVEVIIAKHRNGPTGTVELAFLKEYGKFVNLERRNDHG